MKLLSAIRTPSRSSLCMAAASSSIVHLRRYGVFLSFRGSDTRNTFVSHLREALQQQGIPTFLDSEKLQRGREISEILNEIKSSNVSIIIFSRNYADSPWCLVELAQIMECKKTQRQEVVPVFYHVNPSDVERPSGSYGLAIARHEADPENKKKVRIWRTALRQAASLSGWVLGNDRPEAPQIKEIVQGILQKLKHLYSSHELEGLVGIHDKIQEVESLLHIGRMDIRRVVGIWGMGGVGKTTLAEVVLNRCSFHFDGGCFLQSVRERSKIVGLQQLQRDLMCELFDGGNCTGRMMNQQLRHKRVLIVLDDVDNFLQFQGIIGNLNSLGAGSRMIVTSRDKNVLDNVADQGCIYKVPTLGYDEALELFSLGAEKKKFPSSSHLPLARSFVNYARGNPLAITVLGKCLFKKDIEEWKSALLKLETNPVLDILKVLKISYDGLDYHDKQLYLNIACFLKGRSIHEVKRVSDACGFHTAISLSNLVDKSLADMSHGSVDMHDLLQELGKQLVREECVEEPGKRSRLFDPRDVIHVLSKNTGTETVEAISFSCDLCLELAPKVFKKMIHLKFLEINGRNKLHFPKGLKNLPGELRYLSWPYYPLKSLPTIFVPTELVELDVSCSDIEQLWKGVQDLPNLKRMNLCWCKHMIEMPDLSKAPRLEMLNCRGCESLEEISTSIFHLSNLKELQFSSCKKIRSFPSTMSLLFLSGCSNFRIFPEVSTDIINLRLDGEGIEEIPCETFRGLSSLEELDLSDCKRLRSLPDSLGCLSSLTYLNVSRSRIQSIPTSIIQLLHLRVLNVSDCKRLQYVPELPLSVCDLSKWLESDFVGYILEFTFTNCIKLDKSGQKKIFAFARRSIAILAPGFNKFLEDRNDSWAKYRIVSRFVVLGNEMPDWIQHQSDGGSPITIDFHPQNLLGFVFCAVFDFHHIDREYDLVGHSVKIRFDVQLNSNHRDSRCESRPMESIYFPVVELQHVLLCYRAYVPEEADSQYSELSATIKVTDWFSESEEEYNWKVMKWGFSLIYKDGDDEEEYINDKRKSIFCEDDDEEKRPSKRRRSLQCFKFL